MSKDQDMTNDRMLQIGSFCAVLCVIYMINETYILDFPITITFWIIAFTSGLFIIKPINVIIASLLGIFIGFSYILGYATKASPEVSLIYAPQILTMCVGSSWVLGIMQGTNRLCIPSFIHTWLHRIFLFLSSLWATTSINTISSGLVIDSRELTGFSYITTSDLFSMFCLASLSRQRIREMEFFIFLALGLLVVALLGSRSAVIWLFIVSFFIFINRFKTSSKFISLFIAFPILSYLYYYIEENSRAFNRLNSLYDLENDESLSIRIEYFSNFFNRFYSEPKCIIISCHSPEGHYAHNILSVMEHFGIIGASLFIFIFLAAARRWKNILHLNAIPLFIFTAASVLFTRAWVSTVFPIFLGISLSILMAGKKRSLQT